ncbi:MAG: hypothetical protein LBB50_04045 [Oscillospiraceae bacterium]|jgi:hypothetical protein|nr:hypothetical protein [Oscillospiraceae bacterium]
MPEAALKPTETEAKTEAPFWNYKGHPLVRCGDTVYYGSLADPFVVMLKIAGNREIAGIDGTAPLKVANKINVWLMSTDPESSPLERIVQRCERRGLYSAVDIASVWLERALKKAA